ncbi:MAG: hypothetical protein KAS49_04805 [Candidatus Cloacimonetes bacterium]|nr:hypothetical protein [Candidatus Cloacimonadota bacterium]
MNKKILLFIIMTLSALLAAETFDIKYNLDGIAIIDGTKIDIYRYQKGYSIAEEVNYGFRQVSQFTEFELDYDNKLVILTAKITSTSKIQLYPKIYIPFNDYLKRSFRAQFRELLEENVLASFDVKERVEGQGLIPEFVIELPKIAQTRTVRRLLGNKAGRLSLNGSEKITAEGGNNYNSNRDDEDSRAKDFVIEFRQDLNLQLRGTVGEKIHVDVNHRSSNKDIIAEPSEVNISYEGNEDEVVEMIDGGNISLSLSGSKYISYSASSKGLFGIKTKMNVGNLAITAIVGQDQAKKDTKTYDNLAEADSSIVSSKAYVNKTHYFLSEPQELYEIFRKGDQVSVNNKMVPIPDGWVGNAIKTNSDGSWMLTSSANVVLPDNANDFFLYRDDATASNNDAAIPGVEWDDPTYDWDDDNDIPYHFDILVEGTDYMVDYDSGIVYLAGNVDKDHTIGVTYTTNSGRVIGDASSNPVKVKLLKKMNQDYVDDSHYWKLQIRNIYSMGLEGGIKAEGFELNVYNEVEADGTFNYKVITDPSSEDYVHFPEELIAEYANINPDGTYYNQYLRLDTNEDGKINGDDKTINLDSGYIIFPFLEPFKPLQDTLIYIEDGIGVLNSEVKMNMMIKGEVGRSSISLGINILPGSVIVMIGPDKEKLIENIDYIVDYDFGDVTLLSEKAKDTTKEIFIDYQFKPLFAVDSKTIFGLRADLDLSDNIKLGGTFIYQSEKVKEDRPKIGNENRTVILADIDGEIEYDLPFVTRAIDWLPLIKTDENSSVSLSAEAAVSLTKIYGSDKQRDKKEAYLEDMESILELYPLGVQRGGWVPSSQPYHSSNYGKATVNWFNPEDVRSEDVYIPSSLAPDELTDIVPVMALRMKPNELSNPGVSNLYWSGLMKYIGNEVDFSSKKYVEFLIKVNDDPQTLQKPYVKMHIDLGNVSEDFYTEFGGLGVLNKEQDDAGTFGNEQDVGLDGIANGELGDDPNDHYDATLVKVYGEEEYPNINGTENNNNKLDTEDLDDNSVLNTAEIFYEYSVELNEDRYLQSEYNGWRLYRIPLNDEKNFQIISNNSSKKPDLKKVSYARIWFEMEQECKVKLVYLDIVGNKWIDDPIRRIDNSEISETELNNNNESMNIGIVDNQKNSHYIPAPGTIIEKKGESPLEQSLIIDYGNLQTNHYGLAIQEFTEAFNFLGYERIRFWVYGEETDGFIGDYADQNLIIRIGANEKNYYEIRKPLIIRDYRAEVNDSQESIMKFDYWDDEDNPEIDILFSDLTFLKNETDPIIIDNGEYLSYEKDGYEFRRIGNPTLSNIKELSLGIEATEDFSGSIYFDDIRVANPFNEPGYAGFANFETKLADLAFFSANVEVKSQNFNTSTTRSQNYIYDEETKLNLSSSLSLHKLLPAEWGMNIPLSFKRDQSLRHSRFKSNSDILRENLNDEEKDREQTKSLVYRSTIKISQSKIPRYKILEYLVKNNTLEGSLQKKFNSTPNNADSTFSYSAKHKYNLVKDEDDVELKIWSDICQKFLKTEHHLYLFPTLISNVVNYEAEFPNRWNWETVSDSLPHWEIAANNDTIKTVRTTTNVNYKMFNDLSFTYKLQTSRDMMKTNYWNDLNIGTENKRDQDISFDYKPDLFKAITSIDFDGSVDYNDRRIQESSTSDSLHAFHYQGGIIRDFGARVTLKNRDLISGFGNWLQERMIPKRIENGELSSNPPEEQNEEAREDEFVEPGAIAEPGFENISDNNTSQFLSELGNMELRSEEDPEEKLQMLMNKSDDSEEEEEDVYKAPLLVRVVNYIGRLENITVKYDNNYKTNFDNLKQRPDLWYQIGMPNILREEPDTLFVEDGSIIEILSEEITMKNISDKISTSTSFQILNNLSTSWRYSWEVSKRFNTNKESRRVVFPDVSVTLSELEKIIHLENFLTSSRLSSSFSLIVEESGDIDFVKAERRTERIALSPLIAWNGNFGDNLSSSISLDHSQMEETDFYYTQNYNVIVSEIINSINGNISYSFKAPRGINIPFIGNRLRFKNELTASVAVSYEHKLNRTDGREDIKTNLDRTAYSITPSASYRFSNNINGGLSYKYDWSKDTTNELELITSRLGIWVEIKF